MNKEKYNKANKRIAVLSHKENKTQDEISEAIDLLEVVQEYDLSHKKKKRKLPTERHR